MARFRRCPPLLHACVRHAGVMLRNLLVLSLGLLGGCRAATPEPIETRTVRASTAHENDVGPVASQPPPAVLVSGHAGTRLMTFDGQIVQVLSQTPAVAPRWLPRREHAVVLDTKGHLFRIDRQGSETLLASLPVDLPCPKAAYEDMGEIEDQLKLSTDEEFWISADGTHACLTLSDAPPNLRLVQRDIAVRLSDGTMKSQVSMGATECGETNASELVGPCHEPISRQPPNGESPLKGGELESESPDRTWSLVLVGSALGDILHLQYVLVRKTDRIAFPLPPLAGPWPDPVTLPDELDPENFIEGLPAMQGGETVTWVGPHHLVLDRSLYVAGERIVDLDGNVAP